MKCRGAYQTTILLEIKTTVESSFKQEGGRGNEWGNGTEKNNVSQEKALTISDMRHLLFLSFEHTLAKTNVVRGYFEIWQQLVQSAN